MAVGLVSDEEFEIESVKIIDKERPGRRPGDNNVPPALREIIAEEAIVNGNGSGKELAKMFGISDSSVTAYKNGATSTDSYNLPDANLAPKVKSIKEKIRGKAHSKLILALNEITKDKLDGAKLRDIATTAQAMSAIVRNLDDNGDSGKHINPSQYVIFAPFVRNDNEFKVININEVG